jgi:hypothetical protein
VKPLDDISYVAIGMGLAAAGFFMGGLLCYHLLLPALASSLFGCVLGLISAARVLRQRGLPFSATMGDMRSLREGAKGDGIFVKSPNWKMRGLFCLAVGLSLVASSGYKVFVTYLRHIPVASVVWVTLATGIVVMAMGLRVMQRQPSSQFAD